MQTFEQFQGMDASFWAFVKYISENLGYTERGEGVVKKYPISEIKALCRERGINASEDIIINAAQYSKMRADNGGLAAESEICTRLRKELSDL